MTVAALIATFTTFAVSVAQAQVLDETFNDTSNRAAGTTADWGETAAGDLTLPVVATPLPVNSLTGSFLAGAGSIAVNGADLDETRAVAVGDLDGDGFPDLAFGNNGRNSVYFNNGAGVVTFTAGPNIPSDQIAGNTRSVAIADFNGDGYLDVAFAEFGGGQASRIHFNNGNGANSNQVFDIDNFVDLGNPVLKGDSLATGDVDGDGDIDVVLGIDGGYVKLFTNDGFGNFADAVDIADTDPATGFHARSVLLGDLDGDGDLDLVAAREEDATRIYLNNGAGSFGTPQSAGGGGVFNSLPAPDSASLGDVDGDGRLDLIVGNDGSGSVLPGNANANYLFLNSGNSADVFPLLSFSFADMVNTNAIITLDVDRDGDLDIVTADFVSGNGVNTQGPNHLYLNTGGVFPATGTVITADTNVSKSAAAGDFDNDGDLDLVFANEAGFASTAQNRIVDNVGADSLVPADQLFATAISSDRAFNPPTGVFLDPSTGSTNIESNNVFRYWISNDAGLNWVAGYPNRSVAFPGPGGGNVRFRVDLNTRSPGMRPGLGRLVLRTNLAPSFTSDPTGTADTATQDVLYTYDITASDTQGDIIDIRAGAGTTLPAWLTLADNGDGTATLSGTPLNADVAGPNDVTLEAVDSAGELDTQAYTIVVADANDAPTVPFPTADQVFDQNVELLDGDLDTSLAFDDPDGDILTYSATGLPVSLAIDPATGMVTGILTNDDVLASPLMIVVTADDGNGGTVADDFLITVNDVNDAPTFISPEVTDATEATLYVYSAVAEDIDGDNVTITGGGLAWLTLTDNGDGTADLRGTPAGSDVLAPPLNVTLNVSDGTETGEQTFTITVAAAVDAPVVTLVGNATVTLTVGDTYTEEGATAADVQDGDLTLLIITDNSAVDTGTVGSYAVTYTVSDTAGQVGLAQRTVNVTAVPDMTAPVITLIGGPVTLTVGGGYNDAGATAMDDVDGDITANIVTDNPVDTGTAGTYTVTYNVMDGAGNAAMQVTRTVTVNNPAPPPPPVQRSSGGGGASSLPALLLLAGIVIGRRRRKQLDS